MSESGVPEVESGVDIGFTDFSEFTLTSSLPSGITEYGIGTDSPTGVGVSFDPIEGNYFEMTGMPGPTVVSYGFGIDNFDGLTQFGELLARVYLNILTDLQWGGGPCFRLSGLVGEPSPDMNAAGWTARRDDADAFGGSQGNETNAGSIFVPVNNTFMQEARQNGAWLWVRVRILQNGAVPGRDDWTVTAWHGSIDDEPSVPDSSPVPITIVTPSSRGVGAIGWWGLVLGGAEQRIAYLSFSSDPETVAPPLPFVEPDFPRTILPERVTSLATPGAVKRRTNAGLVQIRTITAIGWAWREEFGLLRVTEPEHMEFLAFVKKAWHSGEDFKIRHPMQPGSGLSPNGLGTANIMVVGAGQTGNSILTDGWPADTANCVVVGDVISIDGEVAVYMVTATADSNASGEVLVRVNPPLRTSPANNAVVNTTDVTFIGTIMGRSRFEPTRAPTSYGGLSIRVEESLL